MHAFCGQMLSGFVAGLFAVTFLHAGEIAAPATPAAPAAPLSSAAPAPVPATPSCPAPAGTFYLVTPASVRTAGGIVGFEPGQAVRLIRTDAKTGRLLITDGKYQVEVAPGDVTTNASVAATLQQREAANRRAIQTAQDARLLAQKRHEAALKRIEINRDVEMAGHVIKQVPPKQSEIYDRPYSLRGNPYDAAHEIIPPVQGPHTIPGSLTYKSNGLGFY